MDWNRLKAIYYGGDYNPDQWDQEVWLKDMQMLAELRANVVTLPVFSWAKLQSSAQDYHFEWLDEIFDLAEDQGIFINLATPTAAQPAWMSKAYPDILPTDKHGVKKQHGGRTSFCPNSPSYRHFSREIAMRMAQRYQHRKALILWHVNNEYGTHCYCETCRQAFIGWLQDKYGTLDNLNDKWYTAFWGHTYYDWDEIQTVSYRTELLEGGLGNRDGTTFQAMAIDYQRFMTHSIVACYENEAQAIKEITPHIPITTNIWGIGPWLDLFKVGRAVDVASWDSYPTNEEHYSVSAFKHDIVRSIKKDTPFILMEQTPNQQNWQSYNALKRPGVMRLMSYQTMAHGADALMFFQVRQSRGACEKYHAALIPHADHLNTRIGKELIGLGQELQTLGHQVLGTRLRPRVALVMNWDNWWSVGYSSGPSIDLNYFDILHQYYKVLNALNLEVDVVEPHEALGQYALVVAPLLNMVATGDQGNFEDYVRGGGTLISGYFSGLVNEHDLVYMGGYPGALRSLMGIWVEEVDALKPTDRNGLVVDATLNFDKSEYACSLICEVIHLEGAQALAHYAKDYYANSPCVTQNFYGQGRAIYLATQPEASFLEALIEQVPAVKDLLKDQPIERVDQVEVVARRGPEYSLYFVMNHSSSQQLVALWADFDLVLGPKAPLLENKLLLEAKEMAILKLKS